MSASENKIPSVPSTRRRFTKTLAAAAGAPILARALPLAAQAAPIQVPTHTPTPTPATEPTPFLQALAGAMQAKFGKHLEPGQIEAAKRSLERTLRNAERMREVKLANADEPDVVFIAAVAGAK